MTRPPAPRLRTGSSGQVWNITKPLRKDSWYVLSYHGPVSDEDKALDAKDLQEES